MDILLIFIKNPEPGKVKTRLARTIGAAQALQVYESLLAHTRSVCLQVDVTRRLYYADYVSETDAWPGSFFQKKLQTGADLGERMSNAFAGAFASGARRVLIIGSDCPEISPDIILSGFKALDRSDVVIGPSTDGGYYLLGMRKHHPELFAGIAWSTAEVCRSTRDIAAGLGLSVAYLPALTDVDTEEDLRAFPELRM